MKNTERMVIEWEITKLIHDFNYHLDRCQYEELVALFTEDCEFDRLGEVLEGRLGILEGYSRRHSFLTRHLPGNIRFTRVDDTEAEGTLYVADFVGQPQTAGLPVVYQLPQPVFVEFVDVYRLTDAGWRIHRRRTDFIMNSEGTPD